MHSRNYYYDRDGNYITLNQWAHLMADDEYRRVAATWVDHHRFYVSTVWLGLDHNIIRRVVPDAPDIPHIFETCVFDHHNMLDFTPTIRGALPDSEVVARYPTVDDARSGHRFIVKNMRKEAKQNR